MKLTFFFFPYPLTVRVCCGTADDFTTSFLHLSLFSTTLWGLVNSRPVHSLMLSSHFFCLPCLPPPFTVHCKMVLARPDERKTCLYHFISHLITTVRRSSLVPIACWILAGTSLMVTWSLHEMHSILQWHLISMACFLLCISAVRVHDSQVCRKIDVTKKHISSILKVTEMLL